MHKQATPFQEAVDTIIEKSRQANPIHDEDYIGEDGLCYCHNCNTPKQMRVAELDGRIVPIKCQCQKDKERLWKFSKLKEAKEM